MVGTVVTERESGDGDGRRVEERRRSRVRRHEVQSMTVTAGGQLAEDKAAVLLQVRGIVLVETMLVVILLPVHPMQIYSFRYHQRARPL